ncbi:hypothetical protein [Methanonatronarchaeum sp. AMET6-2]|uniref:hypothetical protein n=1 Tax=Methanonatronarchaeum sp. AMET6-2 TaxID=2933293 RepID=UPI001FF1A1B4|nr:hypothetical protein [Methanonatronarchaeum sp. AMET6-2]UOY10013.1 hypothetical protein MU439_07070 [Methanonatronarchaeum sp. AMET6-2]
MCRVCEKSVLKHISIGDEPRTAEGEFFEVTEIDEEYSDADGKGKIKYRVSTGNEKWCHIDHIVACYHFMAEGDKDIIGVGGESTNSIRTLVGENGRIEDCSKCERNPAYIWGILKNHPRVKLINRDKNQLTIL